MNRNVYALLIGIIIASALNMARAETMADRKQRIMRKYMRERQDIMQSDLGVPDAPQEDARVAESELFKEIVPEFQRQNDVMTPLPMVQPVPVQQTERNWWLEAEETEENPFADPFSSKTDEKESAGSWSPWGSRDEPSAYGQRRAARDESYSGSRDESSAYGQRRAARDELYSGSRDSSSLYGERWGAGRSDTYPGSQAASGIQNNSDNRAPAWGMTYDGYASRRAPTSRESSRMSGFDGRPQTDTRGMDSGWGFNSAGGYEASPTPGLQQFPFSSTFDSRTPGSQSQTPAYTPYRNPYLDQRNEPRRYVDSLQPQQPQYSRPNSYEKWKDTNKAWDPAADNSYLNELMRNQSR